MEAADKVMDATSLNEQKNGGQRLKEQRNEGQTSKRTKEWRLDI